MLTVLKEGIICEKTNREFESHGVMNPTAIQQGEDVHIYYRAVGKDHPSTLGYCRPIGTKLVADRWAHPLMVPEQAFERNGEEETHQGIGYSACAAALLDLNDPCKVIARLPYTLFKPEFEWGKEGKQVMWYFPQGPPSLAILCISIMALPTNS